MRTAWLYTIVGDTMDHQFENTVIRRYMKDKLEIRIWPMWKIGWEDCRSSHVSFTTSNWIRLEWDLPHSLYNVATDLWRYLDIEVARIVYDQIRMHFNATLWEIQMEKLNGGFMAEGSNETPQLTQLNFPPFEEFENEIRRNRVITTTVTSWATPMTAAGNNVWYYATTYATPEDVDERIQTYSDRLYDRMTDYYDRLIEERRADEQMNMMTYMTQEEYDERRANGTLPENSLVFIHN